MTMAKRSRREMKANRLNRLTQTVMSIRPTHWMRFLKPGDDPAIVGRYVARLFDKLPQSFLDEEAEKYGGPNKSKQEKDQDVAYVSMKWCYERLCDYALRGVPVEMLHNGKLYTTPHDLHGNQKHPIAEVQDWCHDHSLTLDEATRVVKIDDEALAFAFKMRFL